jgi:alpha-tubulin suppressor-like RCC1 family protein
MRSSLMPSRLVLRALVVLWAATAVGCGGGDPYRRLTPLERQLYLVPTAVSAPLPFARIAQGYHASCMLTGDGQAWCWGRNEYGELGAVTASTCSGGNVPCAWQPVQTQPALRFASFSMGERHGCGIDTAGQAWCWGFGLGGQLGDGGRADSRDPVRVSGGHDFTAIDAGREALLSCALDRAGAAWCWGPAGGGALGNGSTDMSAVPVRVLSPQPFVSVGAGSEFGCGLDAAGQAWCWGRNAYGKLGLGHSGDTTLPAAVAGGHRFTQLAVGGQHVCGLDAAGQAWCWGFAGSLGDGSTQPQHSDLPVAVARGHVFASLSAGYQTSCGLKADGQAWCWGPLGAFLGFGSEDNPTSPVAVAGGHHFRTLAVGGVATCGITLTGQPLCWGSNANGAVGQANVDP